METTKLSRLKEVIADFNKTLEKAPNTIDVMLFGASSYDKLGNKKLACEDFQRAKSLR